MSVTQRHTVYCIYSRTASTMKGKVMTSFVRCCMERIKCCCHVSCAIYSRISLHTAFYNQLLRAYSPETKLFKISNCRLYLVILCLKKHGFDFAFCCSEQFNPGVIQMNCSFCQQAAAVKHMNCFYPADE